MKRFKKYKFPIIFSSLCLTVLIAFQHCGKIDSKALGLLSDPLTGIGACSNSVLHGKWISTTDNSMALTFTGDCQYIDDTCKSTGSYPPNIMSYAGSVLVTVESKASSAPAQCLHVGVAECNYQIDPSVSPNQLNVVCGNVNGTYYRDTASNSPSGTFSTVSTPTQATTINSVATTSTQLCAQHSLVKPKVDLLILWDNTSSFNFITNASKNSLNQLITKVSENFDYHVLSAPLVPTAGLLGEAVLIASDATSVSGAASAILNTKDQAIAGLAFTRGAGGAEAGVDRALTILEGNRTNGIFRDGAYTLIVVMSNEDDKGCELSTGFSTCARSDLANYLQPKKDKLLCLRGNATGVNCTGITSMNSSMMRFMTVAPLTFCPTGLNKINSAYKDISKLLYETPYTNGWPSANDQLTPDIANYPDSFNLCTIDFSNLFDGVSGAIHQTALKHVYGYWPVASANDSVDPDTLVVTRDDGKVLANNSFVNNPTDGFKYTDVVQTLNTRFLPTPGEPFTGKMIQLFGTNGNDKVMYPQCLNVKYDAKKTTFGYIYLKNGEPIPASMEVKINGQIVPQGLLNGWDYMGLQFTSSLGSTLGVVDLPAGAASGYFIRLNGNYQFANQVGSSVAVNVYYNPMGTSGTSTSSGTTSPFGCDGIARPNATTCYYKNIPTVQISGGVSGQIYWTSTNLPSSISQNQFVTDATFNVRIIPRAADPSKLSTFGKTCSPFNINNSKKLKVQLMLRKQGVSLGEVVTVTADRDVPSAKASFTVPAGTTQPYILDVVSVLSDTRCTWAGGTSAIYCPYADIPVNTLGPTECVAFDIQYSTDATYDLP